MTGFDTIMDPQWLQFYKKKTVSCHQIFSDKTIFRIKNRDHYDFLHVSLILHWFVTKKVKKKSEEKYEQPTNDSALSMPVGVIQRPLCLAFNGFRRLDVQLPVLAPVSLNNAVNFNLEQRHDSIPNHCFKRLFECGDIASRFCFCFCVCLSVCLFF